jgi:hypothetical protein
MRKTGTTTIYERHANQTESSTISAAEVCLAARSWTHSSETDERGVIERLDEGLGCSLEVDIDGWQNGATAPTNSRVAVVDVIDVCGVD